MPQFRIAILADVPIGTFLEAEGFRRPRSHYATWLEALIPCFEKIEEVELHWICFSKEIQKPVEHQAFGQTFTILPRYKKLISILTAYHFETRRISKLLKKIGPDLVHAWGCEDAYGLAGARAKQYKKLFTLQGSLSECLKNEPNPKLLMKIQASFEKKTISAFSEGTGESAISTGHLERINPEMKTEVIDYGVDHDFFEAEWNPAESPTVLFAGTVNHPKGIQELIQVFEMAEFAEIRLEIAGEGVLLEELKGKNLKNVHFLGRLTRADLVKAMERAWLLAIPTHADTGPSVLKEARVVGLPVITTHEAGAAHYISGSMAGEVVQMGDVEGIAEAIQRIISSREGCLEIGRRKWSEHREIFDPSTAALNFSKLYQILCQRQRKGA